METIRLARLDEREIRLLDFAVRTPEIMEIIGTVHDLLQVATADRAERKVAEKK